MENVRLLLVVALAFIGLMLWEAWQSDYGADKSPIAVAPKDSAAPDTPRPEDTPSPQAETPTPAIAETLIDTPPPAVQASSPAADAEPEIVVIENDVLSVNISTLGGTVERVALLAYPINVAHPDQPVELLTQTEDRTFIYQGGLAGNAQAPTHHDQYTTEETYYRLNEDQNELIATLRWRSGTGLEVDKHYKLKRGSYIIEIEYGVRNESDALWRIHFYEQLQRSDVSGRQGMVYTYTGAAFSKPEKRFEKFDYDDLEDVPLDEVAADAWIGVMQHYFIAALVPPQTETYRYYSKILDEDRYLVGFVSPAFDVAPGESETLTTRTYIGPKRHDILADIAPGLELAVDYGVLWFIAKPLFVLLEYIYDITGNWGWGIMILTLIIKIAFYPLSAAGYRSMANMRKVQPRLLALRDRYADDKAQLNQAMMQLYKEEKINPLGGCFPILIQIPVFIALYWVLLESVEIRQAPFVLWIHDLSGKDPFFILPVLMGLSMWGQQKLNPAPLDPTQAKVMQLLPWVFTVFFAFFPSGLVLYWLVNNILSIAQQWRITRIIEKESSG